MFLYLPRSSSVRENNNRYNSSVDKRAISEDIKGEVCFGSEKLATVRSFVTPVVWAGTPAKRLTVRGGQLCESWPAASPLLPNAGVLPVRVSAEGHVRDRVTGRVNYLLPVITSKVRTAIRRSIEKRIHLIREFPFEN